MNREHITFTDIIEAKRVMDSYIPQEEEKTDPLDCMNAFGLEIWADDVLTASHEWKMIKTPKRRTKRLMKKFRKKAGNLRLVKSETVIRIGNKLIVSRRLKSEMMERWFNLSNAKA